MSGGKWLPTSRDQLIAFLREVAVKIYDTDDPIKIEEHEATKDEYLLPPVQDLKDRIDTDPKFNMYFNQMFTNVPPEKADLMPIQNYTS